MAKLIKKLRKLGGTWKAIQMGFGTYRYEGSFLSSNWEVKSYAHFTPRFDGDDDSFTVFWHVIKDGQTIGFPTKDPVSLIKDNY